MKMPDAVRAMAVCDLAEEIVFENFSVGQLCRKYGCLKVQNFELSELDSLEDVLSADLSARFGVMSEDCPEARCELEDCLSELLDGQSSRRGLVAGLDSLVRDAMVVFAYPLEEGLDVCSDGRVDFDIARSVSFEADGRSYVALPEGFFVESVCRDEDVEEDWK